MYIYCESILIITVVIKSDSLCGTECFAATPTNMRCCLLHNINAACRIMLPLHAWPQPPLGLSHTAQPHAPGLASACRLCCSKAQSSPPLPWPTAPTLRLPSPQPLSPKTPSPRAQGLVQPLRLLWLVSGPPWLSSTWLALPSATGLTSAGAHCSRPAWAAARSLPTTA